MVRPVELVNRSMKYTPTKYSKWYFAIIENARAQTRSKKIDYFESHHVHPKSLGGKQTKENVVLLTAREHLICHQLLVKMFDENSVEQYSMIFAFKRMTCAGKFHSGRVEILKSRHFEMYRRLHSKAMSAISKANWQNPEYRDKLLNAVKNRRHSENSKTQIRKSVATHWEEMSSDDYVLRCENISKGNKEKCADPDYLEKISEALKKPWENPEFRKKMSLRNLGKIYVNNGVKSKMIDKQELEHYLNQGFQRGKMPLGKRKLK